MCLYLPPIKQEIKFSSSVFVYQQDMRDVLRVCFCKRNITADTTLRLGRYFGTSLDLWMNLQKTYKLDWHGVISILPWNIFRYKLLLLQKYLRHL